MIAGWELVVLLLVAAFLLIFGPKKIPELARSIGRALGEFRRARKEVEGEIIDARAERREPNETSQVKELT